LVLNLIAYSGSSGEKFTRSTPKNASVAALVLRGVDRESLRIFDTIEGLTGGLYNRLRVSVRESEGKAGGISIYVAGPAVQGPLADDWFAEAFRKRDLPDYLRRIVSAWRWTWRP
jgi:hypothetical protein